MDARPPCAPKRREIGSTRRPWWRGWLRERRRRRRLRLDTLKAPSWPCFRSDGSVEKVECEEGLGEKGRPGHDGVLQQSKAVAMWQADEGCSRERNGRGAVVWRADRECRSCARGLLWFGCCDPRLPYSMDIRVVARIERGANRHRIFCAQTPGSGENGAGDVSVAPHLRGRAHVRGGRERGVLPEASTPTRTGSRRCALQTRTAEREAPPSAVAVPGWQAPSVPGDTTENPKRGVHVQHARV